MTKYAIIPTLVKTLYITHTPFGYRENYKLVDEKLKLHIGKYYVAEHSKTPGLNEGDKFIIIEKYGQGCF